MKYGIIILEVVIWDKMTKEDNIREFECSYCWRVLPEDEAEFKFISIRAGKNEWQYKGRVCKECREYLKGIWKEVKDDDN